MKKYNEFIGLISAHLKNQGWGKSGTTFFIEKDNNVGILDFQKSKDSSKDEVLFTINLAVSSCALRHYFGYPDGGKIEISDCHWRKRIGFVLPQKKDHWWEINETVEVLGVFTEVASALDLIGIPEVEKNISDNSLKEAWLNKKCSGITDYQMDKYLTALKAIEGGELQWKSRR